MTFLDNKIYIAGFDSVNITFWVFDTIDNTSIEKLLGSRSQDQSLLVYVNHIGKKIYLTSGENQDNQTYATLWIIDSQSLNFTKKKLDNSFGVATSYVQFGSLLYIGGGIKENNLPYSRLWICTLDGDVIDSLQIENLSFVASMAYERNHLVLSGAFQEENGPRAKLVITDFQGKVKKQNFLGNELDYSKALNVYIPSNLSESLLYFSPSKFQKGV